MGVQHNKTKRKWIIITTTTRKPLHTPADMRTGSNIILYTIFQQLLHIGAEVPVPHTCRGRVCHCSRVTTSTACPSRVIVLSIRVATGAIATWTGRLPWAKLVTTVWYMLTGIWTRPGAKQRAVRFIYSDGYVSILTCFTCKIKTFAHKTFSSLFV